MTFTVLVDDMRLVLALMPAESVDSIVCDPPYEYGFMGKAWDSTGVAFDPATWAACLRALKPGGHLLAFGATRTVHRIACAIEDAGFDIRDQIAWMFGSGFPKSHDVSKAIDKAVGQWRGRAGAAHVVKRSFGQLYERTDKGDPITNDAKQWQGWGTALKPAMEPVIVARKPLVGTVAANVLAHGTGAINVDGCRIGDEVMINQPGPTAPRLAMGGGWREDASPTQAVGRWPANVILDDEAGQALNEMSGTLATSRFFYSAKADGAERDAGLERLPSMSPGEIVNRAEGSVGISSPGAGAGRSADGRRNIHATVKPIDLMRHLCRLVTPPGGVVLDPFFGSGTTGVAAILEGFDIIGVEMDTAHACIAWHRCDEWSRRQLAPGSSARAAAKKVRKGEKIPDLFRP
jgi:site-specific DNA-methyltransferase (adenine-specific)